jgi:hypothetical protein
MMRSIAYTLIGTVCGSLLILAIVYTTRSR